MRGADLDRTDEITKKVRTISGIEKLRSNIENALLTPLGSRPNLPDYGSRLHELKFEFITDALIDLSGLFIQECVIASVPEVAIVDIEFYRDTQNRELRINIIFKDRVSGQIGTVSVTFAKGVYQG